MSGSTRSMRSSTARTTSTGDAPGGVHREQLGWRCTGSGRRSPTILASGGTVAACQRWRLALAGMSASPPPDLDNLTSQMLDERKTAILSAVVQEYITTALPVGSTHIADAPGVRVSPATVRNEMAVLEQEGYLVQPHTSAGRDPDRQGVPVLRRPPRRAGRIDQPPTPRSASSSPPLTAGSRRCCTARPICSPGSRTMPPSSSARAPRPSRCGRSSWSRCRRPPPRSSPCSATAPSRARRSRSRPTLDARPDRHWRAVISRRPAPEHRSRPDSRSPRPATPTVDALCDARSRALRGRVGRRARLHGRDVRDGRSVRRRRDRP